MFLEYKQKGVTLDLLGLLIECEDALNVPTHDYQERKELQQILSKFINSKQTPNHIKKVLVSVSEIFLNIQRDVMTFAIGPDNRSGSGHGNQP